ncbi:DEAD/DEAH box helicase family protein [Candidatus Micrarchaeota archaeon]|nr:DEAD/DEAH box helicase family protein [Candidatus Micrarchaeota archaeon]
MKLTPRAYQLAIYNSIIENGNTLVVLPTGLGKTLIALMLIRELSKKGRCLFLTPTKPLAKQHYETVQGVLGIAADEISLMTGDLPQEKRKAEYNRKVIIATPQTIRNDLKAGVLSPDFSLCIFDECHRAVGDYAYVPIADKLNGTIFVGLTASPGGKKERIEEVAGHLKIRNIEIRTSLDEDVAQYVQKSTIIWIPVELSPFLRKIKVNIDAMISSHARALAGMGFPPPLKHKGKFMEMRNRILSMNHGLKYPALVEYSILLNLLHMSELLETQGVHPLRQYIRKIEEKESKSAKRLLHEQKFAEVKQLIFSSDEDHPKLAKLADIVKRLEGKKMIVFAQYRDQIAKIESELAKNGITARQFIGKKDGFTRKMQEETMQDFRCDKFNVLVASSIGEEGLDIPAVDTVIFYEPIPSEIRSIQRRGRAARLKKGEIYILMTRGTRDEYYYWSSIRKEKQMKEILERMKWKLQGKPKDKKPKPQLSGQTRISHFV